MPCPKCGSHQLKIREAKGLEWVVLLFRSKRKYRCRDCGYAFRAPDRRGTPRDAAALQGKADSFVN